MLKLSNEEQIHLVRRSAEALEQLKEGEDAVSVLSKIYCENLPDKSPRQGQLMAKELLSRMRSFQDDLDQVTDSSAPVHRQLKSALEGLTCEQQCTLLRQSLRGLEVFDTLLAGEKEALDQLKQTQPDALPASEEIRDALLEEAAGKLAAEDGFLSSFEEAAASARRGSNRAKARIGEDMLQAMKAMIVYTMAKNGELSGFPRETTLAQVVLAVCAQEEQSKVTQAQKSGYLTKKEAGKKKCSLRVTVLRQLLGASTGCLAGTILQLAGANLFVAFTGVALAAAAAVLYFDSVISALTDVEPETIAEIPVKLDSVEQVTRAPAGQKHETWPKPVTGQEAVRASIRSRENTRG